MARAWRAAAVCGGRVVGAIAEALRRVAWRRWKWLLKVVVGLTAALLFARFLIVRDPGRPMERGNALYAGRDYVGAIEQYDCAIARIERIRLDPAMPWYNRGNALVRLGRFREAVEAYRRAGSRDDEPFRSERLYNLATVHLWIAEAHAACSLVKALDSIEESLRLYRDAMLLNVTDMDFKINYELAVQLKDEWLGGKRTEPPPAKQKREEGVAPHKPDTEPGEPSGSSKPAGQEKSAGATPGAEAGAEDWGDIAPEQAVALLDMMKREEEAYRRRVRWSYGIPRDVERDW